MTISCYQDQSLLDFLQLILIQVLVQLFYINLKSLRTALMLIISPFVPLTVLKSKLEDYF